MTLEEFNKDVLAKTPEAIFVVRFEQKTPFGNDFFNGVSYMEFTDDYIGEYPCEDEQRPALITEQPIEEDYVEVVGYVNIQEINLATMAIIANTIKRRYDL